jgi:hypothetical protein
MMDIGHEFTFGKAMKEHIQLSHFWITLDNNGTILDPTIRQFNPIETTVYMGDILANETTRGYEKVQNTGNNVFSKVYALWAGFLLQEKHSMLLLQDFRKRVVSLNISAAHVLMSYVNNFGLKDKLHASQYGLYYFKTMSVILRDKFTSNSDNYGLGSSDLKYKNDIIETGLLFRNAEVSITMPTL